MYGRSMKDKKSSFTHFKQFLQFELQSEYFRSKTAVSIESMPYINENDILLVGGRTVGGRINRIVDEAFHAYTHHRSGTDDTSRVLHMRLILKMIDELRHSAHGITCRLIKSDQTIVLKNGHLVNVIQYLELSMKDAMFTISERLRRKGKMENDKLNSLEE